MKRLMSLMAGLLLFCGTVSAQQPEVMSIDPLGDSINVAAMRVRLDSIRTACHRPTVGLVLSGGGAKGAAHAGVLRYLEELDIPVDVITGTSMGGLIGGLYSVGHSAAAIDTLLREADWNIIMSDDIPLRYLSFTERERRQEYAVSLPFGEGQLKKDARRREVNLWNTLPSGYITGLNVDNIFSSMTVGYQDSMDFRDLPIPFFCVATDLVSQKSLNWSHGNLVDAMRSTMSIPFIFEPLRKDGMILIDGGTRNNFPSDILKDMGVDIIIGVTLATPGVGEEEMNNAVELVMPFISLLTSGYSAGNVNIPTILIKPDMSGYNMLSFSKENISDIIQKGYDAAKSHADELAAVKKLVGNSGRTLNGKKAVNLSKEKIHLSSLSFDGIPYEEARYLEKRIKKFVSSETTASSIEQAKAYLFGTGAFHSVSYRIEGKNEPYGLVFECVPSPKNVFSLGVRADTKELVSLKVNMGLGVNRLGGSKLFLTTVLRDNFMADVQYVYDSPYLPTVNYRANFSDIKADISEMDGTGHYLRFSRFEQSFHFSDIRSKWGTLSMGATLEDYLMLNWMSNISTGRTIDVERNEWFHYFGVFADSKINTLDRPIYPKKGFKSSIGYRYLFLSPGHADFSPEHIGNIELMKIFPIGRRFALIPTYNLRFIVADDNDLAHRNVVGGVVPGRYVPQQIPFLGVMESVVTKNHLSVFELKARAEVVNNLFVSLGGGYMKEDSDIGNAIHNMPEIFGVSLEAGYWSVIGPLRASLCWSNFNNKVGAFISYGYDF